MSQCHYHKGRPAVITIGQYDYCAKCRDGIGSARTNVDPSVEPSDCFVMFHGGDDWEPIIGTGCAHWVAHERGIRYGRDDERCLKGYTFRVSALISAKSSMRSFHSDDDSSRNHISVNDIYVAPNKKHCGLVVQIIESSEPGGKRRIIIRHDSSRQGGVVENDFDEHFGGRGEFKW